MTQETEKPTSSTNLQKTTIKLHPKQGKAYKSTKRVVLCSSGIQGGKSFVGAWKLKRAIYKQYPANKYPDVAFIVTAPEHKTMVQSTRQAFDRVFYGHGTMREQEQTFYLRDGRKIYFRTMVKNPWSCEGIQKVVHIWADEACQYPRLAYINLESRTAIMRGQLFMTSTPYAANWPKREIIDKWKRGDPDIDYFEWLSCDNPIFPMEEYERQKRLLSKREFERKYMGVHSRMEGLIFEDFGDDNIISAQSVDLSKAYIAGGIDWGFNHPTALSIRGFQDGDAYGMDFFKGRGMSVTQVLDLIEAKHKSWGVRCWWAGSDRPDMIMELNNRGIPCLKYYEGREDYREVDPGNQKLLEFIRLKKYKVFKEAQGLEDLRDEYETYHWDSQDEDEKGTKAKPVNVNDDLMAAERYVTIGTMERMGEMKITFKPETNAHVKHDRWRPGQKKRTTWDAY